MYWRIRSGGYKLGLDGANKANAFNAVLDTGSGYIYTPSSLGTTVIDTLLDGRDWFFHNGIPLVLCQNIDTLPSLFLNLHSSNWFEVPPSTYVITQVHLSPNIFFSKGFLASQVTVWLGS